MDRIFSEIDYRIINFMADNGREPNLEERSQLLRNHVNNANHPDSESTLNRAPVITQIERYKTGVLKLVFGYKI